MKNSVNHIVIDARIRRASTGRPVDRLLAYLPQIDTENHYTILVKPDDPLTINASNFTVQATDAKQFSFNLLQQFSFSRQLYKLKPDLVFFTMTGIAPLFYFGRNITFTHDLTMLRYVRAGKMPYALHLIRMIGYRLLFWKGNRFAKHIITPSRYVANDLASLIPSCARKTSVIYEASEPALSEKSQSLPGIERPFIFHLGSPFPHKNIENLVRAFDNVKKSYPDLTLVLAGKKEYYFSKLESWTKTQPHSKDIIFTDYISDAELKWLYENAECYVLPSLSEGFGLPGLEAMAHRCPLVSSSATCLPEIYGEAAHYFDPSDTTSMAAAVINVISSEQTKKRLVVKGTKQITRYSWKKMSSEIHELITVQLPGD